MGSARKCALRGRTSLKLVDADEVEEHPLEVGVLVAVMLDEGRVGPPRVLVLRRGLVGPIEVDVAEEEEAGLVEVVPREEARHSARGVGLRAPGRALEDFDRLLELELLLLETRPGEDALRLLGMGLDQGSVLLLGEDVLALRRVGLGVAIIPGDELAHPRRLLEVGLGLGIAVLGDALVARAVEGVGGEGHVDEAPAEVAEGGGGGEDEDADPDDRQEGMDEGVGEGPFLGLEGGARALLAALGDGDVALEHAAREGRDVLGGGSSDEGPDQLGLLRLAALARSRGCPRWRPGG